MGKLKVSAFFKEVFWVLLFVCFLNYTGVKHNRIFKHVQQNLET